MAISTIVLAIAGVSGGGGGSEGGSPPKDKEALKKWLDRLASTCTQTACRKGR